MEKTIVQLKKKPVVLVEKLHVWYYTENYGSLIYYVKAMVLWEKTMVLQ